MFLALPDIPERLSNPPVATPSSRGVTRRECLRTHIAVSKPRAPTDSQRVHKSTHNPPDMKFSLEAGLISIMREVHSSGRSWPAL